MAPTPTDDGAGFFERNYDRVYRYLCGMVRDPVEAERSRLRPSARISTRPRLPKLPCQGRVSPMCIL